MSRHFSFESWLGFGRPERMKGKPQKEMLAAVEAKPTSTDPIDRVIEDRLAAAQKT